MSALVAVLMAVRAPGQVPPAPARSSDRPDILLITLDSLANAHLSAIGHRRPTTPTIDRLAAAGTFFTHTVASSNYTTPTLATLMTGLHPWRHKALQLKSQPVSDAVAGGLPARLHAGGYVLRAVSTNPYGGPHKNGFGPWFETVAADRLRWLTGCSDWLSRYLPRACAATEIGVIDPLAARINLLLDWLGAWEPGRHLDPRLAFTAAAQLWVKPTGGRPKFLWVHVVPPHDPYVAPAPFLGRFDGSPGARTIPDSRPLFHFSFSAEGPARQQLLEARYDESIAATDADLAAFVETLERDGQLSNAVVILSSDHGESFSHDYGGHGGPMLHEPLIRIPLIFAGLGIPVGNRISTPVEQADVPATIIALAGLNVPSEWDGRSLLTLIRAGGGAWKPTLSMNLESSSRFGTPIAGSVARTEGRWKLVHYWGLPNKPGVRDLRTSLFDLETDPGERADLSAANPARAAGMRARIEQALAAAWPN
ncbi:sulfatase [Thermaurantiacus tibetensis]|uniref:sulfatase family protein n=2 Tax=Thermaurantiacus tibetensis TaxID=2759035 RepID=UPI001A9CB30B|nr:sulfatase [Thermaurantiacus tibetensis]